MWSPNSGPQTEFVCCPASEALYGGAAGGGKSAASIALPLRWIENPAFRCLFLRREAKYLSDAIDKSTALYPHFGAKLVQSPKIIWTFPSGAKIWLNHVEHEKDVSNYDSLEFQLVIFEELTHFTEKQYLGIKARIRGTDTTLPRWVRSTTNPGGDGHEWVFKRFGPWLDPAHPTKAKPGEVLWYDGDEIVPYGTTGALTRTFIPARLSDNPYINQDYASQLKQLDPVRRAQLLDGNWLVQPARGLYFRRAWLEIVDAAPVQAVRVRAWDRAASPEGDWTAGVRLARAGGVWYVEDVVRFRGTPAEVVATIKQTAELDGKGVAIALEKDPGQAGTFESDWYIRALAGWNVRAYPIMKDKITRVQPVSAQAEAGNLKVVRGRWNEVFIQELEAFPEGSHDDQADGLSCGFNAVMTMPYPSTAPRLLDGRSIAPWG